MAEDRYSWLDEDAAERLLRGEPLGVPDAGAGDGRAEERARRLSAALRCVADPARLPAGTDEEGAFLGEAVVLAAFREAAGGAQRPGSGARGRTLFGLPRAAGGGRRPALGRPLRAGLAVALAGCALGGVAVAAGTGVLPTPFNHSVEPGPSGSAPGTGRAPSAPGHGAGGTDGESPRDHHETDEHGEKSPGAGGHGGTKGLGSDRDEPAGGRDGAADRIPVPPGFGDAKTRGAVIALCREYTADTLDRRTRGRIEAAAGGPAAVEGYCGRLLDGKDDNDAEGSRGGGSGSDTGAGARPGSGDSGGSAPGTRPGSGSHADPYVGSGPGGVNPPGAGGGRDGRAGHGERGGHADRPPGPLRDEPRSDRRHDREHPADRENRGRENRGREDRGREDREHRQAPRDRADSQDGRASGAPNSRTNGAANGQPGAAANGRTDDAGNRQANSRPNGAAKGRADSRHAADPGTERADAPGGTRASSPSASPAAPSNASRTGTPPRPAAAESPEAG
ncbi:hypothetical protein [Streptomyces albus]|uniref:hypothetical protein n=1 Tax=Streptomyces albus TaxID=1888 RepID=UPI0006921154|nr:hypothetical protein [Streptomyces albus]